MTWPRSQSRQVIHRSLEVIPRFRFCSISHPILLIPSRMHFHPCTGAHISYFHAVGDMGLYTRSDLTEVPASSQLGPQSNIQTMKKMANGKYWNNLLNSAPKVLVGISWNLRTNQREMIMLIVEKLPVCTHFFSPCIKAPGNTIGSLFIIKYIPIYFIFFVYRVGMLFGYGHSFHCFF